ncbi:RHS repeat domain-containing protein [Aequorivita antarctica]|uniref:RHS repeat-associated core domain-containing protein n=1 Tax=Aequorivita antarctica TaxID=153266 RepID=A0A5C6YYJ1_9FLAO|nr:RHS repeat-associated core domain-containing protein [Aequorivita antarctica]TXD72794.1 hypothetical protein ESU54_11295 [Aequorivita antarctica]SRX75228.1 hypothetical protein AEQU3_02222 [Aequorivita antarctica]
MLQPGRHANTSDYRYGFQGQEMDDEIKGEGNSINYKYRMHDPRVGRFFAMDPLDGKYPDLTPYQFSSNMPIHAPELEGLETSFELRQTRRDKVVLKGEISREEYMKQNNAEGYGALIGLGTLATIYSGGEAVPFLKRIVTWAMLNPVTVSEIANESTAITWNLLLDEPYPGPAIGDDVASGSKLIIKGLVDSKLVKKITIPLGKLNFALGEGSTYLKDLSKVNMREIENMAKSLTRGNKFKDNGIKTSEDIAKLTVQAFDEGVRITDNAFNGIKKQISLEDGTKVNFSFEKIDDVYELKSISIPEVNKDLPATIRELKDKAIESGNKNL